MKSFNGPNTPLGVRLDSRWCSGPTLFQFSGLCFCNGNLTPSGGLGWRTLSAFSSRRTATSLERSKATVWGGVPAHWGHLEIWKTERCCDYLGLPSDGAGWASLFQAPWMVLYRASPWVWVERVGKLPVFTASHTML